MNNELFIGVLLNYDSSGIRIELITSSSARGLSKLFATGKNGLNSNHKKTLRKIPKHFSVTSQLFGIFSFLILRSTVICIYKKISFSYFSFRNFSSNTTSLFRDNMNGKSSTCIFTFNHK